MARLAHPGPWGETWRAWRRIRVGSPGPPFLRDALPRSGQRDAHRETGTACRAWAHIYLAVQGFGSAVHDP